MEKRSLKIFIACALGAGIGSVIALEMHKHFWWFWWAGPITGGIVGYLSYEFKAVLSAIRKAWKEVVGYRPDWEKITRRSLATFSICSMIISAMSFCLIVVWGTAVVILAHDRTDSFFLFSAGTISAVVCFFLSIVPVVFHLTKEKDKWEKLNKKIPPGKWWLKSLIFTNPFAMIFYWPLVSLKWMFLFILSSIKNVAKEAVEFIKNVFVLIHSDIRLLCGIDAALGACVGYFAGSAVLGMLAGGVFGVVNYEVVSRRILRLKPKPNR